MNGSDETGKGVMDGDTSGVMRDTDGVMRDTDGVTGGYTDGVMRACETLVCRGHENVLSRHKSTFEVTKEESLTKAGDCIIAVGSDKGAADLSPEFKRVLAHDGAELITVLSIGDMSHTIHSFGSAEMTFTNATDLVWRRSGFVCPRTVGIFSDTTAAMIPREMVRLLREGAVMRVSMTAVFNPEVRLSSVQPLQGFFHSSS